MVLSKRSEKKQVFFNISCLKDKINLLKVKIKKHNIMHFGEKSRNSLMGTRLIHFHSSRQRQNHAFRQHPISSIDVGSSCFVGDHQEHGVGEDRGFRIVEWRKNTKEPIVSIKQYSLSIVKTSSKPIHVPTAIQIEKIIQRLDDLKELTIPESLFVMNSLISGYGAIRKFFGFATFSLRFCGINGEGKVKAWINSDFQLNEPEGQRISDQSQLVLKIVQGVKKISAPQFCDFYSYYLRNASKNICDFKYMYSLLRSYSECTKNKMPPYVDLPYMKNVNNINNSCEHGEQIGMSVKKMSRYSLNPTDQSHKDISMSLFAGKKNSVDDLQKHFSLKNIKLPRNSEAEQRAQESETGIQERTEEEQDTPSNQNHIQVQQPLQLNPKFSYTSTIIKNSQTSTSENTNSNNKSSLLKNSNQGSDWIFTTFSKTNSLKSPKQTYKSQNALQEYNKHKVSKVENGHQNHVGKEKVSILYRGKNQLKSSDQLQEIQEKGDEIIKKNRWTNKIQDLFTSSELKESRVLGQQPQFVPGTLPSTHKLDRWARVVIKESTLPSQY